MADAWLTTEQAAVALKLSVRTVNRHVAAGKLESRLSDGRREVRVSVTETDMRNLASAPVTTSPPPATEEIRATTHTNEPEPETYNEPVQETDTSRSDGDHRPNPSQLNAQTMLALADSAAEKAQLAVLAYQTLARAAEHQVHSARRGAWFAWSAVAVMGSVIVVAVGWTSQRLTQAQMQAAQLTEEVRRLSATAEKARIMSDKAEKDAAQAQKDKYAAREQAARMEGKLSAMAEAQTRPSTTQPSFVRQLLGVFENRAR